MQQGTYREIYLDNAATTRASAEVSAEVARCLTESYGNPSSLHDKGIEADGIVAKSAAALAAVVGVNPDEILFTSGGTEANNMAIFGAIPARRRASNRVVISSIEHPSVYNVGVELRRRGFDVVFAPVDCDGVLDLDRFREAVGPGAAFVSVMHVNNETGAIQPVDRVAAILRDLPEKPLLHVDSVQSLGHIPFRPADAGADLARVRAHKSHGPQGCGARWIRKGVRLDPIVFGGGQQRNLRSGTENVPGIAGFGAACRRIASSPGSARESLALLRDAYLQRLRGLHGAVVIGPRDTGTEPGASAPHILNVSFPGVKGEVLVRALGALRVYVSTGAACSSRK
ncbi:MAG: cysteine desulfurase family protein, partial [Bacillota bacterium]